MRQAANLCVMAHPAPALEADGSREFADDVRRGLTSSPKRLSAKYLYDALGTRLFEAICELPSYGITRAERALLDRHGSRMIAPIAAPTTLVELGSGSGEKLAIVVRAMRQRTLGDRLDVHVVDISEKAIASSLHALQATPFVTATPHCATYELGLQEIAMARRRRGSMLVLFLGSNIGNFEPEEATSLLAAIRAILRPGDALLLGADLAKPEAELLLAYDDPIGVTSAFNKNVLVRINRELGGDFDLSMFCHHARFNAEASRVEMHLVSRCAQSVRIDAAGCEAVFRVGESIWTESSCKFTLESLAILGERARFACREQWVEPKALFCETLFMVEAE
jgi:dimethylhistidine N-methyltransferase